MPFYVKSEALGESLNGIPFLECSVTSEQDVRDPSHQVYKLAGNYGDLCLLSEYHFTNSPSSFATSTFTMHGLLSVLLCFIATSIRLASATGCASPVLLPAPSGPFEVGLGTLELVDSSRTQPFAPSVH